MISDHPGLLRAALPRAASTSDQNAALQVDALSAAGCYRVFVDTMSGSIQHRPELDKLLDQIGPGDTLVVWRLDRLGRSIRHLIDQLHTLAERDGFRRNDVLLFSDGVDLTNSIGPTPNTAYRDAFRVLGEETTPEAHARTARTTSMGVSTVRLRSPRDSQSRRRAADAEPM